MRTGDAHAIRGDLDVRGGTGSRTQRRLERAVEIDRHRSRPRNR
jgi:hypothetical protein